MARSEGSVRPLQKGRCTRWLVRWYDPVATEQAGGRRVYPSKTIHGTKQDAQRFLRKQLDAKDRGRNTQPTKQTVWDCLDAWLAARDSAGRIRPQTVADYRDMLERYVKGSSFGGLKLSRVGKDHVAAFYEALKTAALKRRVHILLRAALEWGRKRGFILTNPTDDAELPHHAPARRTPLNQEQVTRLLALAYEEADTHRRQAHQYRGKAAVAHALAKGLRQQGKYESAERQSESAANHERHAEGSQRAHFLSYTYFALWQLLFSTGIRPSEALALRWGDVRDRRLYVERSKDKRGRINKPKTTRGSRDFPLHGPTIDALETHRANQRAQAELQRAAGKAYDDQGYVFATQNGGTLDWTNVRNQRWNPLVDRAGISGERAASGLDAAVPYLDRHTHATILSERGTQITAIASRLGNKPQVSADHYIGTTEIMEKAALEATASLLFAPTQPSVPS